MLLDHTDAAAREPRSFTTGDSTTTFSSGSAGAQLTRRSRRNSISTGKTICFVSEELGQVGEINLNGRGSDPSYLRQSMGFEAHTAAGGAASAAFPVSMYVNGRFDRVGVWIEQVDANFVERHGYDRDGDLYKLVQRSNLGPAVGDTTTGLEKKTNEEAGVASFAELVEGVEFRTEAARQRYLRDHLDMAQMINYMAVRIASAPSRRRAQERISLQ